MIVGGVIAALGLGLVAYGVIKGDESPFIIGLLMAMGGVIGGLASLSYKEHQRQAQQCLQQCQQKLTAHAVLVSMEGRVCICAPSLESVIRSESTK